MSIILSVLQKYNIGDKVIIHDDFLLCKVIEVTDSVITVRAIKGYHNSITINTVLLVTYRAILHKCNDNCEECTYKFTCLTA